MKTFTFRIQARRGRRSGSTLMLVMLTLGLIAFVLGSYLTLLSGSNKGATRSTCWNQCIPVLEAGIEEAIAHVNKNIATSLAADGWTARDGWYSKTLMLDGSTGAYSVTRISGANPPVIESQGYVRTPLSTSTYVTRSVRVNTSKDGLFVKGLVAKGQINLNGNNIRVDSFDSTDSSASTGGRYDPAKFNQNGDVATDSQLVNSLNVGNADIYGDVSTGPGGTVAVGAQGFVTGTITDDMNVAFPDVAAPFSTGSTPTSGTVNGTSYTYVLNSGNYIMSSLSMSGNSQKLIVTGNAVLYVTGNVSLAGQADIQIASGATLKMYVGGASASIAGNGVANSNSDASSFMYYGLPTNTSVSFSGNAAFTGVIYAPSAALSLGGGGNNTYDFVGASVSNTATMNGHYNFHYDENLAKVGPSRGYVVSSWNEF